MEKIIKVGGMSCGHCKAAVEESLMGLDGVDKVEVDLDSKEVRISGSKLDNTRIGQAIEEIGFELL